TCQQTEGKPGDPDRQERCNLKNCVHAPCPLSVLAVRTLGNCILPEDNSCQHPEDAMSTTTELVDRFKQEKNLSSDNAAARALGLSRQAISSYRAGLRHAEPEVVRKLAEALREDPEIFVLRVQAERETIPARKRVWVRCLERLSAAAALSLAI